MVSGNMARVGPTHLSFLLFIAPSSMPDTLHCNDFLTATKPSVAGPHHINAMQRPHS